MREKDIRVTGEERERENTKKIGERQGNRVFFFFDRLYYLNLKCEKIVGRQRMKKQCQPLKII